MPRPLRESEEKAREEEINRLIELSTSHRPRGKQDTIALLRASWMAGWRCMERSVEEELEKWRTEAAVDVARRNRETRGSGPCTGTDDSAYLQSLIDLGEPVPTGVYVLEKPLVFPGTKGDAPITGAASPPRSWPWARRVVIESPYAGDVERNLRYLRAAMRDAVQRGESPYASHGLLTQPGVLDDADPVERTTGIALGQAWRMAADAIVFYTDLGMSSGMEHGLDVARAHDLPVEFRTIPGWAESETTPPSNVDADRRAGLLVSESDVSIEPFEPPVCSLCNDTPVRSLVYLDLRCIGSKIAVGEYCSTCAIQTAHQLRAALVADDEGEKS